MVPESWNPSSILLLLIFGLVFLSFLPVHDAAGQVLGCEEELTEANNLYARGRFDETIALLDQCLNRAGIDDNTRMTAFRLKGLSFIGKGLELDAQNSVKSLLELVPDYEPDPILDPPDFVEMVNEMKEEIEPPADPPITEVEEADPTPQVVDARPTQAQTRRKKSGAGKWILGGLGVAAVGAAVYIFAVDGGGDGGGGGPAISEPPPLPE